MSTHQEYWDACLIKTWRNDGDLIDAYKMFFSITGIKAEGSGLYRVPTFFIPYTIRIRIFVAQFLPKINDWLWDKPKERDVDLLKKLSTSKYDVHKKAYLANSDKELRMVQEHTRKNKKMRQLITHLVAERNHNTDWGIVKGSLRVKRAK